MNSPVFQGSRGQVNNNQNSYRDPNKFHIKPILTDQRNDTQFNNTLPNDILTNNSQTNYTQPNYTQPNHTHHSDSRIPASKGKLTFSL